MHSYTYGLLWTCYGMVHMCICRSVTFGGFLQAAERVSFVKQSERAQISATVDIQDSRAVSTMDIRFSTKLVCWLLLHPILRIHAFWVYQRC